MVEYIVRTDRPIRLDAVLHQHGIHYYEVRRLEKHGRLIDAEELCKNFMGECWENLYAYVSETPTVLEASNETETPRKAHICPHYKGGCGLDDDIFCYCSRHYEMCDKYKKEDVT